MGRRPEVGRPEPGSSRCHQLSRTRRAERSGGPGQASPGVKRPLRAPVRRADRPSKLPQRGATPPGQPATFPPCPAEVETPTLEGARGRLYLSSVERRTLSPVQENPDSPQLPGQRELSPPPPQVTRETGNTTPSSPARTQTRSSAPAHGPRLDHLEPRPSGRARRGRQRGAWSISANETEGAGRGRQGGAWAAGLRASPPPRQC
ncbi:hypothetical protein ACRRTK_018120 [Alexandromys fortis]